MQDWFKPLKKEDIVEKIDLNLKKMTLKELREKLYEELFETERGILKLENVALSSKVQAQNIREQLKMVEDKIGDKK